MIFNKYVISLVFDISHLRFVLKNWYLEVLLGVPFGPNLTCGGPFGSPECCFRLTSGCYLARLGAEGGQQQLKDANHDG